MHGLMLGALDSEYETDHDVAIAPVHFATAAPFEPGFAAHPYAQALASFQAKTVVSRSAFDGLKAAAQRRAFTVAGMATQQMLETAKDAIVQQVRKGAELRDFRQVVRDRLESSGWTPVNKSHVENIFRTNVMTAYNSGRHAQMTDPDVLAIRPYWQVLGVNDGRSRPSHKRVHGWVFLASDPGWHTKSCPFGYMCRCRVRSVTEAQVNKLGLTVHSWTEVDDLPDEGFVSGTDSYIAPVGATPPVVKGVPKVQPQQPPARPKPIHPHAPTYVPPPHNPPPIPTPTPVPVMSRHELAKAAATVKESLPSGPSNLFLDHGVLANVNRIEKMTEDSLTVLSTPQREALIGYSNGFDFEIRGLQRGLTKEDLVLTRIEKYSTKVVPCSRAEAEQHVDKAIELKKALETVAPTKIDMTMYRGMSASEHTLNQLLVDDFRDNAKMVTSSSARPSTADYFASEHMGEKDYRGDTLEHRVVFVFEKGVHGIPMASDELSSFKEESEALLPGTMEYKITSRSVIRSQDGKTTYLFHMREMP